MRTLGTFALALLLASCSSGGAGVAAPLSSTPELTGLTVSLSSSLIHVGELSTAAATGRDQFARAIPIGAPTWSIASTSIATINSSGIISAVSPGETTVIAMFDGKQGQLLLRVLPTAVGSVAVNPPAVTLAAGSSQQLTATVRTDSGRVLTDRTVTWAALDSTKATVSETGLVTAISPGSVTITATCDGVVAKVVIAVPGAVGSVSTVVVSPSHQSIQVGESVQLSALLTDISGDTLSDRVVTWSTSPITGAIDMVSVSPTGFVTAASVGVVTVEALSEFQRGSATITVTPAVDTGIVISLASPAAGQLVGDTLTVIANVRSINPLASVVAATGSVRTVLELRHVGALGQAIVWVGMLDVSDVPSGSHDVTFTATDSLGAQGIFTTTFLRDTRVGKGGSAAPPKQKTLNTGSPTVIRVP